MSLYAYWESVSDKKWYYDLCWETILLHNPKATLLGPDDVQDIIGEFPKSVKEAYVTHRVDWIRKMVIHTLGGAWVDMDYICWDDLSFLSEMSRVFEYVGYREWGGGWIDSFFAAKKGSKIIGTAAEYALRRITDEGSSMSWLGAATQAMEHSINKYPWEVTCEIPTHVVTPVSCGDTSFFTHKRSQTQIDSYNALGCMSSVHSMGNFLDQHDRESIVSGEFGLSRAIHRAFNGTKSSAKYFGVGIQDCPRGKVAPSHIPWAYKSENLGDHIQSLAASMLWGVENSVDRDDPGSWPPDAVVPLVGWWGRSAFPASCRVVLVGFHCAEEGVHQVKKNAEWFKESVKQQGFPAFCRDTFTRDLLRSMGVPAEFGGCVSLTLPKRPGGNYTENISIDASVSDDRYSKFTNIIDEGYRNESHKEKLVELAKERLELISRASGVITSRIHVWLPSLAMGIPVSLQTKDLVSRERLTGYNIKSQKIEDLYL